MTKLVRSDDERRRGTREHTPPRVEQFVVGGRLRSGAALIGDHAVGEERVSEQHQVGDNRNASREHEPSSNPSDGAIDERNGTEPKHAEPQEHNRTQEVVADVEAAASCDQVVVEYLKVLGPGPTVSGNRASP